MQTKPLKNTPRARNAQGATRQSDSPSPAESPRRANRSWAAAVAVLAVLAAVVIAIQFPRQRAQNVEPAQLAPTIIPTIPAVEPPAPEQAAEIEPPGVARPLKLFAVYPGGAPDQGRAALGPAEASSRTYLVGALLENGARLTQVFNDRVVLVRDGRRYTLYLPNRGQSDGLASDTPGLTVGGYAAPQPDIAPPAVRATDFLRTVPAYRGDVITGFLAYPGTRSSEFERWGLKPGDVLVSASGQPLSDVSQMEAVVEQLGSGAVVVVDVLRDNARQRLTLDGAALLAAAAPQPAPMLPPIQ